MWFNWQLMIGLCLVTAVYQTLRHHMRLSPWPFTPGPLSQGTGLAGDTTLTLDDDKTLTSLQHVTFKESKHETINSNISHSNPCFPQSLNEPSSCGKTISGEGPC